MNFINTSTEKKSLGKMRKFTAHLIPQVYCPPNSAVPLIAQVYRKFLFVRENITAAPRADYFIDL